MGVANRELINQFWERTNAGTLSYHDKDHIDLYDQFLDDVHSAIIKEWKEIYEQGCESSYSDLQTLTNSTVEMTYFLANIARIDKGIDSALRILRMAANTLQKLGYSNDYMFYTVQDRWKELDSFNKKGNMLGCIFMIVFIILFFWGCSKLF